MHAANLSVDWASRRWQLPDVVDDALIVISSLSKTSAAIHSRNEGFIYEFVAWRVELEASREVLATFWTQLDVVPSLLALMVEVDPIWDKQ